MRTEINPECLKAARLKKGITMAEAARQLNISKIGYCRYEYGDRTPSMQMVEAIARCFDTSVSYLIGETTDDMPDSITINREDDAELFEFIVKLREDENLISRMMAYLNGIDNN
ncbi:MAG: helix-turn-helix transcriptional regulator [Eubacterium sp.]|nr:helix-turn-helix transcriptional regulator [Eubacterium sp.]